MSHPRPSTFPLLLLALLLAASHAPSPAVAKAAKTLKTIKLPPGYKPEGIAQGFGNYVYITSHKGKIARVDTTTGNLTEIDSIAGFVMGLKVDPNTKLLFAANGNTGGVVVYQLGSDGLIDTSAKPRAMQSVLLADYYLQGPMFINDVALRTIPRPGGKFGTVAYLTDSARGNLYSVSGCPQKCVVAGPYSSPLLKGSPDPAFNNPGINGLIAAPLPAGNFIFGNTAKGKLFKVSVTGSKAAVVPVSIKSKAGAPVASFVTNSLLSVGKRIFAVEAGSKVTELKFNAAYTAATIVSSVTDKTFAQVSDIAAADGMPMYAVNARYKACPPPEECPNLAFQLIRVDGVKL